MHTLKTFALLFICLSLFAGGMAQAAMPCCMSNADMSKVQMDDGKSEMKCHKQASKADIKKQSSCAKCAKCTHCASVSAFLNTPSDVVSYAENTGYNLYSTGFSSNYPNQIYSPPKIIS